MKQQACMLDGRFSSRLDKRQGMIIGTAFRIAVVLFTVVN
jgi:hypothetical protein